MTKKQQIEMAQLQYDEAAKLLRAHEKNWRADWDAAENPFVAIAEHTSKKARATRMSIIQPWLDARAQLKALKQRTRT